MDGPWSFVACFVSAVVAVVVTRWRVSCACLQSDCTVSSMCLRLHLLTSVVERMRVALGRLASSRPTHRDQGPARGDPAGRSGARGMGHGRPAWRYFSS